MYKYLLLVISIVIISCNSNTKQIDELLATKKQPLEQGRNIDMTYSDSANIILTLESPFFISNSIDDSKIIEYPEGIKISFIDNNGRPKSWLIADRAINKVKEKKFYVQGHVKFYNKENDKLETSELIWDEKKEILSTEKFVKITQPTSGDTIYGYGFVSNKEFTEFEIKRKLFGKIIEDIFDDIK